LITKQIELGELKTSFLSGAWGQAEKREASQNRLITKPIELGELKTSFLSGAWGEAEIVPWVPAHKDIISS
jgi:hypothetical protein